MAAYNEDDEVSSSYTRSLVYGVAALAVANEAHARVIADTYHCWAPSGSAEAGW